MDITAHPISYKGRASIFALAENITEKLLNEEELKRSHADIRQLNAHLQTVREEERAHISRELHDELGQQLTGIKMDMVWMRDKIDASDPKVKLRIEEAFELMDDTVNTTRRIHAALRPAILDDLGLFAALNLFSKDIAKRTGISFEIKFCEPEPILDESRNIHVFRIFQEAINNAAKHSNATAMIAAIKCTDDNLLISIKDNGVGFDEEESYLGKSFGLRGMKERATMLGGELGIVSSKGKGTVVNLRVPINS